MGMQLGVAGATVVPSCQSPDRSWRIHFQGASHGRQAGADCWLRPQFLSKGLPDILPVGQLAYQSNISRNMGKKCNMLYDLALEVTHRPFCHILLVTEATLNARRRWSWRISLDVENHHPPSALILSVPPHSKCIHSLPRPQRIIPLKHQVKS